MRNESSLMVEVAAPPGELGAALASRVFDALERRLSRDSCYRGRVLSLEAGYQSTGHAARIRVHELESVARDEVILPESTLQALERNVLRFAEQRSALRALGLSTQKGLLFHGAPGTGKTHCIRYLAGRLPGHTTFLITAGARRRRLIALYARTLPVPPPLVDDLARRTDGASPAFIKEFLRRIAQHHLDAGDTGEVSRRSAEAALHEMLFSGGVLNTRLLGGDLVAAEMSGADM